MNMMLLRLERSSWRDSNIYLLSGQILYQLLNLNYNVTDEKNFHFSLNIHFSSYASTLFNTILFDDGIHKGSMILLNQMFEIIYKLKKKILKRVMSFTNFPSLNEWAFLNLFPHYIFLKKSIPTATYFYLYKWWILNSKYIRIVIWSHNK